MLSVVRAEGVETLDVVYLFRLDVLHEQCAVRMEA